MIIALAALVLTFQLLVPPIIGLANNGDFERVTSQAKLTYATKDPQQQFWGYVVTKFNVTPDVKPWEYRSSEVPLVRASVWVSSVLKGSGQFDLRVLGFLHLIIFLVGVCLILRGVGEQGRYVGPLLLCFFCDVGYIAYLNSFYTESASLLFLLTTVGAFSCLLSREQFEIPWFILLTASAALWVTAKAQNGPMGILIALLLLRLLPLYRRLTARVAIGVACLGLLVLASVAVSSTPKDLKKVNIYNTVFTGVLKYSPTPEDDLAVLGTRPEYAVLKGTHSYQGDKAVDIGTPEFQANFFDQVGHGDVLRFYLSHPTRILTILRQNAGVLFGLRITYLGNLEKADGVAFQQQARSFSYWSTLRQALFSQSIWLLPLYFVSYFWLIGLHWLNAETQKGKVLLEGLALLGVGAIAQLLIAIVGDGTHELGKHLFMFNALLDTTLIVSLVWAINLLRRRVSRPA